MNDELIFNSIKKAEETPCIKCLKKIQAEFTACYIAAGDDEVKKKLCVKKLAIAIKFCPCNPE